MANETVVDSVVPATSAVVQVQSTRSRVKVNDQLGGAGNYGSTNDNIRRFKTIVDASGGSDITYADSATLGSKFTINTAGLYFMSYCDGNQGGAGITGITKNADATLSIIDVPAAKVLASADSDATFVSFCSAIEYLVPGDIILAQSDGSNTVLSAIEVQFTIVKIS